eukprot:1607_1
MSLLTFSTVQISAIISTPDHYLGPHGQLCPLPQPDAICSNTSPTFGRDKAIEQSPGYTHCGRVGDCCGCASISCGNDSIGCNTFLAGDFGAYGVENINIIGAYNSDIKQGGVDINCFGNEACAGSIIAAFNTSSIYAAKSGSMRNAKVSVFNPVDGFGLYCIGEGSCENSKFQLIIPGPPAGFMCNPDHATRTIIWDGIVCYGEHSCKNMDITINNMGCDDVIIGTVGCYSASACYGTVFSISGDVSVDQCDLVRPMPIAYERFVNENAFCANAAPTPTVVNRALAMGPRMRPNGIYA